MINSIFVNTMNNKAKNNTQHKLCNIQFKPQEWVFRKKDKYGNI